MYQGIAEKRREVARRTLAIVSMIGSFAVVVAMLGGAYLHDFGQHLAHYQAGILAIIALGVSGLFVAIFALVIGSEI